MQHSSPDKSPTIFIAEDDEDDYSFICSAFKELNMPALFRHFANGQQLIAELAHGHIPDLVILDLNMPVLDGRSALKQIRNQSHYDAMPVIVLSTSNTLKEKEHCLSLGASEYFSKPYNFSKYIDIVREMKARWLSV